MGLESPSLNGETSGMRKSKIQERTSCCGLSGSNWICRRARRAASEASCGSMLPCELYSGTVRGTRCSLPAIIGSSSGSG